MIIIVCNNSKAMISQTTNDDYKNGGVNKATRYKTKATLGKASEAKAKKFELKAKC